jgi:hypothetical protein
MLARRTFFSVVCTASSSKDDEHCVLSADCSSGNKGAVECNDNRLQLGVSVSKNT